MQASQGSFATAALISASAQCLRTYSWQGVRELRPLVCVACEGFEQALLTRTELLASEVQGPPDNVPQLAVSKTVLGHRLRRVRPALGGAGPRLLGCSLCKLAEEVLNAVCSTDRGYLNVRRYVGAELAEQVAQRAGSSTEAVLGRVTCSKSVCQPLSPPASAGGSPSASSSSLRTAQVSAGVSASRIVQHSGHPFTVQLLEGAPQRKGAVTDAAHSSGTQMSDAEAFAVRGTESTGAGQQRPSLLPRTSAAPKGSQMCSGNSTTRCAHGCMSLGAGARVEGIAQRACRHACNGKLKGQEPLPEPGARSRAPRPAQRGSGSVKQTALALPVRARASWCVQGSLAV